jgi:trans-aconitate methyltransferase
MAENNPAYQALVREVAEVVDAWSIPAGLPIVDIGAGTGNFSILLATRFPGSTVIHVDASADMN